MWEPKIDSTTSTVSGNHSSSSPTTQKESFDKLNVEDSNQIDSGFLSSEQILNSGFSSYGEEEDPGTTSLGETKAPPATDPKAKDPKDSVVQSSDSTYLDSGLVDDIELSKSGGGEMLIERELDNGLAEWLCTLDLKNGGLNQINNLSRKVDSATASLDQLNISDAAPSANKRTKTSRQPVDVPEKEEPWEVCYIQDGEGDT